MPYSVPADATQRYRISDLAARHGWVCSSVTNVSPTRVRTIWQYDRHELICEYNTEGLLMSLWVDGTLDVTSGSSLLTATNAIVMYGREPAVTPAPSERPPAPIEASALVYLDYVDGRWELDPTMSDGPVDLTEDGVYSDFGPYSQLEPADQDRWLQAERAPFPTAKELAFMILEQQGMKPENVCHEYHVWQRGRS